MTNSLRTLLLGAGLALLSSTAFAAPAVTIASAGFATGPGSDYDTHGKLPVGAHVDVIWCGTHDDWCLVTFHNKNGWVPQASLTFSLAHNASADVGQGGNSGGGDDGTVPGGTGPIGKPPAQAAVMATEINPNKGGGTPPISKLHLYGIQVIQKP